MGLSCRRTTRDGVQWGTRLYNCDVDEFTLGLYSMFEEFRCRFFGAERTMPDFDSQRFKDCWRKTEVVREYRRALYTFGDMELPYVFAAEHGRLQDKTVIRRGVVTIQKPRILLPGHYRGPEFQAGFEHAGAIPPDAVWFFRAMGLPYSEVHHRALGTEQLEYGRLQEVLDRFDQQLESQENHETGLIKGLAGGTDISLMRYAIGLAIKSAPENIREFFEHLHRQRGEPIRPHETITDEEIDRLFE